MRPIKVSTYIESSSRFGESGDIITLLNAKFLLLARREVPTEEGVGGSHDRVKHDASLIDAIWDQLYGEIYCELEHLLYFSKARDPYDSNMEAASIKKLLDRLEFIRTGK